MDRNSKRYNDINTYLRSIFNCRVQKIYIDAGLSCPNRDGTISTKGCIYCNTKGSGTGAHEPGLPITEQVRAVKHHMTRKYKAKKFIAYFQSFSNTYAPVEHLRTLYDAALAVEDIVGLFIGTRPDCVDESIMDLLQHYNENYMVWLEYGLQSAHDATLTLINRGHDFKCFEKAVAMAKRKGIKVCVHIILGLPGEKEEHMLETARIISDMGIDGIKFHHLSVLKGTALEQMYNNGSYHCLEQKEYMHLVCDFLELLPKEMIIHRLTGDPHTEDLIAPMWSRKKSETQDLINQILIARDSWQGKLTESDE
ncbi:MAG: TIGR01212 family radical SAM protein [Nitrospira sp.]|nr:TIGR01212 family radical SAM protein [bacterium]MBL7049449.1 TIGR01212 family radical SAM protein [Nitrospira sp.]